jgi:hypothetical protein
MAIFQFHLEHRIGQRLNNDALEFDGVFFTQKPLLPKRGHKTTANHITLNPRSHQEEILSARRSGGRGGGWGGGWDGGWGEVAATSGAGAVGGAAVLCLRWAGRHFLFPVFGDVRRALFYLFRLC